MSISIAISKICAIEVADLRWMATKIFDGNHPIATAKQTSIFIDLTTRRASIFPTAVGAEILSI